VGVGDDTFEVQVAPGTTIKVAKQAVVRVIEPAETGMPEIDRADDDVPPADQDR
jgi:hypothetical protein